MIHSYLVHVDWKDHVNRYIKKKDQKEQKENKYDDDEKEEDEASIVTNIYKTINFVISFDNF